MRALRWCWAPFGLMGRITAWVMLPPLGLALSWRKGRNRRHRQLVTATSERDRAVQHLATTMGVPRDLIDGPPRGAFHWTQVAPPPSPGRCVYPLCDCPTSGPCQRP